MYNGWFGERTLGTRHANCTFSRAAGHARCDKGLFCQSAWRCGTPPRVVPPARQTAASNVMPALTRFHWAATVTWSVVSALTLFYWSLVSALTLFHWSLVSALTLFHWCQHWPCFTGVSIDPVSLVTGVSTDPFSLVTVYRNITGVSTDPVLLVTDSSIVTGVSTDPVWLVTNINIVNDPVSLITSSNITPFCWSPTVTSSLASAQTWFYCSPPTVASSLCNIAVYPHAHVYVCV